MLSLDYQLFLGFPISSSYQEKLNQIPSHQREVWIHPDYLQQIEYRGSLYLGKSLGPLVEAQMLETVAEHLCSLLCRLVADYPYQKEHLILLALPIL